MKNIFSAIAIVLTSSNFAMADDDTTSMLSPEMKSWFFLLLLGAFLIVCCAIWCSEEMATDPVKKGKTAKILLLPTFYMLATLFCIGLIGMVLKSVIGIIMG